MEKINAIRVASISKDGGVFSDLMNPSENILGSAAYMGLQIVGWASILGAIGSLFYLIRGGERRTEGIVILIITVVIAVLVFGGGAISFLNALLAGGGA